MLLLTQMKTYVERGYWLADAWASTPPSRSWLSEAAAREEAAQNQTWERDGADPRRTFPSVLRAWGRPPPSWGWAVPSAVAAALASAALAGAVLMRARQRFNPSTPIVRARS